jgi:hypothetical protein
MEEKRNSHTNKVGMVKRKNYVIYFHFDERLEFHEGFNELFDIGI